MTGNRQLVGYMEAYVAGDDFNVYLERLENYMDLNEAVEEKFKVMLLSNLIGPEASHRLSKACKPKKIKEYKYDEIVEKCKDLFAPKYTSCISAVKFNRRVQARGEGIQDYAIELMSLAESCQFGEYKDKALRNQLISGVLNRNLRAELMALDEKKTFKEIVQRAMAAEIIQKDVDIEARLAVSKEGDVNKVQNQNFYTNQAKANQEKHKHSNWQQNNDKHNNSSGGKNMRNSSQDRNYSESMLRNRDMKRNIRCFNCGKYGHFARECRFRRYTSSGFGEQHRRYNNNNNNNNSNDKDRYIRNNEDKFPRCNGGNEKFRDNHKGSFEKNKQDCNNVERLDFGNLSLNEMMENNIVSNIGLYESFESIKRVSELVNDTNVISCDESKIDNLRECSSLNSAKMNIVNSGKAGLIFSNVEFIDVFVENKITRMEIDTGACVSLCTLEQYEKEFAHVKLEVCDIPLSVLTGEKINIVGKLKVKIKLKEEDQCTKVELVVIDTKKKMFPLLGRSWLDKLFPGWREWFRIEKVLDNNDFRSNALEEIRKKFKNICDGNLKIPIQDKMSEKD